MDTMLEKLEEIKQLGAYSVNLFFGEGEGADDSDVPTMERSIKCICSPVGYLGSMRALYKGTVESFLEFDFNSEPTLISNPPQREEYEENGFYCWGSESSVEIYKDNGKLFPFSK